MKTQTEQQLLILKTKILQKNVFWINIVMALGE
jgi:hypothetical protein